MNEQWISDVINKAMEMGRQQISRGNVATYIPELGKARKEALGLCVSLPDGTAYSLSQELREVAERCYEWLRYSISKISLKMKT